MRMHITDNIKNMNIVHTLYVHIPCKICLSYLLPSKYETAEALVSNTLKA
jgi:hypothetical protein